MWGNLQSLIIRIVRLIYGALIHPWIATRTHSFTLSLFLLSMRVVETIRSLQFWGCWYSWIVRLHIVGYSNQKKQYRLVEITTDFFPDLCHSRCLTQIPVTISLNTKVNFGPKILTWWSLEFFYKSPTFIFDRAFIRPQFTCFLDHWFACVSKHVSRSGIWVLLFL